MGQETSVSVRNTYLPWLDSLRFIAAFMVLLSHSRMDFFYPYEERCQALFRGRRISSSMRFVDWVTKP